MILSGIFSHRYYEPVQHFSSVLSEQLAYGISYEMQGHLEAPKLRKRRENRDKRNTSIEGAFKYLLLD